MLFQLVIPIAVFTGIVLVLSSLVLFARRWLEPSGPVSIDVNGERVIEAKAGRRLLGTLADNGIFLPAACGGRGTCGQCRVTVISGGGPALPPEAVHVDADERAKGVRLACSVKIREDMKIVVPTSALDTQQWSCEVVSARNVATYIREIVLELPSPERIAFSAGAYVVIEVPPHRINFSDFEIDDPYQDDWRSSGLLALESAADTTLVRAYSLANPPQQDDQVVLLVRIAPPPATAPPGTPPGQASSYLFSLRTGDTLAVSGPFGEFRATDSDSEMLFVAGGVGISPIRSIILDQLSRGTQRKMSLWYGARDRNDLCYVEEFEELARQHDNFELHIALSAPHVDDEWQGHKGFIHLIVHEHYLSTHRAPGDVEYYLCGPPLMSASVIEMLEQLGVNRSRILFDDFGG
ncbi:MAG: NADH:ubiquinone reductase (Na(+)-transporting) subunit F [Gammaproteobacteria bacterium]|nr:NADH:ubiquinone reductase (Na(+)-transporting) subunit F [Gammaproteobacteria bacterium]